jgi:hypothetical protein
MTAAIDRYQLSRDTFDNAANAGQLTKHKLGRASFLEVGQINAWIMGKPQAA